MQKRASEMRENKSGFELQGRERERESVKRDRGGQTLNGKKVKIKIIKAEIGGCQYAIGERF